MFINPNADGKSVHDSKKNIIYAMIVHRGNLLMRHLNQTCGWKDQPLIKLDKYYATEFWPWNRRAPKYRMFELPKPDYWHPGIVSLSQDGRFYDMRPVFIRERYGAPNIEGPEPLTRYHDPQALLDMLDKALAQLSIAVN